MAYGDFSAVGVGTTTMVCGDQVVGFGHPFNFSGKTSLTLHGADSIYIQEDPLGAPFKVANPSGPVGVIDQDRLSGIKGLIGTPPATTQVHTSITVDGKTREGDTYVSVPDFLPDATAFGTLNAMDRVFDHVGPGSSLVTFTVSGHTKAGQPFTLTRTNRYADTYDITYTSVFEAADDLYQIVDNDFTDVTIDNVNVNAAVSSDARAFNVGKVEYKYKGVWKKLKADKVVKARSGKPLRFRVTLNSRRGEFGSKTIKSIVAVPDAGRGAGGIVTIGNLFGGGGDFEDEGFGFDESDGPSSFPGLIQSLATAPRNDDLSVELDLFTEDGDDTSVTGTKPAGEVILDSKSWELRLVK